MSAQAPLGRLPHIVFGQSLLSGMEPALTSYRSLANRCSLLSSSEDGAAGALRMVGFTSQCKPGSFNGYDSQVAADVMDEGGQHNASKGNHCSLLHKL